MILRNALIKATHTMISHSIFGAARRVLFVLAVALPVAVSAAEQKTFANARRGGRCADGGTQGRR